ncbi:MAG: OmpA family protein [Cytophagaceae bacterium]|jgi:outer membrane protein OmpA-like peptidoglycan-associated protein|nr:OmpA family protein [Cytophagaceae bacterium]
MIKLFFSLISIVLVESLYAQQQASQWYFGRKAGISFTTGQAQTLSDGQLNTEEGCITIADGSGKLLFYSDGITVWNNQHTIMPNGSNLNGHPSSTSSGVVIQQPGVPSMYYLFTVAASGEDNGLQYSVVNLSLQNGLGDVVSDKKNIPLRTPVTEKLTAVSHRNGRDYWIIAHDRDNSTFVAYLLTTTGLSTTPVESAVGTSHAGDNDLYTQGYMKSNPDGSNLAVALEALHAVEILDFDNATGKVSHPVYIAMPSNSYTYGIEFSPDGSLLYVSAAGTAKIYQYNLQAGSEEAIKQSGIMIGMATKAKWIGALQIAIDGKIYFTLYETPFLGCIPNPNSVGQSCGFMENAIDLQGRNSSLGLPTFSQNYFYKSTSKTIVYFDPLKINKGSTYILKSILFDFNASVLKKSSYLEIDKIVAALKNDAALTVVLKGHTDNIGNKSYNIQLSNERAKAVAQYIINKGIAANRIVYEGYGSSQPVSTNATEAGRALNRRVEVVFK